MNAHYTSFEKERLQDFYKVTLVNKRSYTGIKLATLSMVLYFSPVASSQSYVIAQDDIFSLDYHSPNKALLSVNIPNAGLKVTQLSVTKTAEDINRDRILTRFETSFLENKLSQVEQSYFYPTFEGMAELLKILPVMGQHVAIGRMDGTVTFNVLLPKNVLLTVSKAVYQNGTDHVMFSISLNKRILVVDRMPIGELMDRVESTLNELA